jgi:hypothetical protein
MRFRVSRFSPGKRLRDEFSDSPMLETKGTRRNYFTFAAEGDVAQALLPAGSTLVSTLLPGSPQNAEMSLGGADTSVRATSGAAKLFLRVS